jgi:hypothetical protein
MNQITLVLQNESDLELLIEFAKRMNAIILDITERVTKAQQNPVFWLEQIAEIGGVKSINNPSVWQKETRCDKPLLNRKD